MRSGCGIFLLPFSSKHPLAGHWGGVFAAKVKSLLVLVVNVDELHGVGHVK